MRRLNFGCGSIQPDGWVNLDREDHGQEHVGSTDQFLDDNFDVIAAHCVLQMTEYNDVAGVLTDLYRVLKPGGVLRLSLPDITRGFLAYQQDDIDWFPNGEPDIEARFSNWITWYSTTRSLWTADAIIERLMEADFSLAGWRDFGASSTPGAADLDTRQGECFFIEAVK